MRRHHGITRAASAVLMTGALAGGLAAAALLPARPEPRTAPTTRVMGVSYDRTSPSHHWDSPPGRHQR